MAHGKWSDVEARGVLEAWRRSGLPLEKFARQRGFVAQRLRWWRHKFNRVEKTMLLGPAPAVLPVRVAAEDSRRGEPRRAPALRQHVLGDPAPRVAEIVRDDAIPSGTPVVSLAFGPGLTVAGSLMVREGRR